MKTGIITIIILAFTSCNNPNNQEEKIYKPILEWQTLKIESRNQTIIIDKNMDYGVRDTCDFEEIKLDKYITENKPINRGQEYLEINQQEKDSLFKYVYDIVNNPIYTDQFTTSYVGNISISFSMGNTTRTCKYNSVGNWTTISSSTQNLYKLLIVKTKISEY